MWNLLTPQKTSLSCQKTTRTRHLLHKNWFLVRFKPVSHRFEAVCSGKTKFSPKWKKRDPPFSRFLRTPKNRDGGVEAVSGAARQSTNIWKPFHMFLTANERLPVAGEGDFDTAFSRFQKVWAIAHTFFKLLKSEFLVRKHVKNMFPCDRKLLSAPVTQKTGGENVFFWKYSKKWKVQGYFPGLWNSRFWARKSFLVSRTDLLGTGKQFPHRLMPRKSIFPQNDQNPSRNSGFWETLLCRLDGQEEVCSRQKTC